MRELLHLPSFCPQACADGWVQAVLATTISSSTGKGAGKGTGETGYPAKGGDAAAYGLPFPASEPGGEPTSPTTKAGHSAWA